MVRKFKRSRRVMLVSVVALLIAIGAISSELHRPPAAPVQTHAANLALTALEKLAVKDRAPMTGHSREQFASDWAAVGSCDMREQILNRDLTNAKDASTNDCTVLSGTLHDPYTGKIIQFRRSASTSGAVQIDHVVALSDAWTTGAQRLSANNSTTTRSS